jgi:hypothetical protein
MLKPIEVSLRIPNTKVRALDENGYPIDHASVRFKRVIQVESIPRVGDSLTLPTASGRLLPSSAPTGTTESKCSWWRVNTPTGRWPLTITRR